jgi:RNA polymerase sigma factor (sigma-70 family)
MILYAAHGYTMKEIAEIQGCSTETIKKRIQRGREKIRKMLGEDK